MADETRKPQTGPDQTVPDNSDPTGIGPPPPGAETHVEDGRGITEGPAVGGAEKGAGEGRPS
jgi:hypothetical protein